MPDFIFSKTDPFDHSRIQLEFSAETLDEVLEVFECFLRGCGFVFLGHVEIAEEED